MIGVLPARAVVKALVTGNACVYYVIALTGAMPRNSGAENTQNGYAPEFQGPLFREVAMPPNFIFSSAQSPNGSTNTRKS